MILSKFFKNHLTIPQATKLFEEVTSQTHPDIADLKRLVDFHKAPVGTKDEMQALDHNPDKIKQMINHLRNYPKNEEIFNIVLEEVSNGIVAINKFGATI